MPINLKILFQEQWLLGIVFLVTLSAFIVLSISVRNGQMIYFDQTVLTWFHKLRSPFLDHYFSAVTWLGSLWVLIPLYLLLTITLSSTNEHFEKILGITFWGTVITTYFLKYEMERKRPHFFGALYDLPLDPSFPSAHSAQIAAFAIGLGILLVQSALSYQFLIIAAFMLIVLSVFASRMYLQVHFPTDVIAGFLVAVMWGIIAVWSVKGGVFR